MSSSTIKSVIICILLVIVAYLGIQKRYPMSVSDSNTTTGAVACTEEAMICPDGTAVGRQGPNCEFVACPTAIQTGIKTTTVNGITFQFPAALPTTYITAQDRPPTITVVDGKQDCASSMRVHITLSDREYCVQTTSEGAAGSVYNTHTYSTHTYSTYLTDYDKTVFLTFTVKYIECTNYDTQDMEACKKENETFNLDVMIDTIVTSMTFTAE